MYKWRFPIDMQNLMNTNCYVAECNRRLFKDWVLLVVYVVTTQEINDNDLETVQSKMTNELDHLKQNGPTTAIWVQDFHMASRN